MTELPAPVSLLGDRVFFPILERSAIWLACVGCALAWLAPFLWSKIELIYGFAVPGWFAVPIPVVLCAPAMLLGLRYLPSRRCAACAPPVIAAVVLFAAGLTWVASADVKLGAVWLLFIVSAIPLGALLTKRNYLELAVFAFVIGTLLSFAIGQYMRSVSPAYFERWGILLDDFGGTPSNPNTIGYQAALAAVFAFALAVRRQGHLFLQPFYISCSALCALVVFLTGSRSALICLLAAIGAALFFRRRNLRSLAWVGACVVVFSPVVATFALPQTAATNRFVSDPTTYTAGDRLQIWEAGLSHFTTIKLLLAGTGSGGVDQYLARATDEGEVYASDGIRREHSHNGFLEWFFSFGLLGVPVLLWLFAWAWMRARRFDFREAWPNLRTVLLVFVLFLNMASVVYMASFFPVLGAVMLALLSKLPASAEAAHS